MARPFLLALCIFALLAMVTAQSHKPPTYPPKPKNAFPMGAMATKPGRQLPTKYPKPTRVGQGKRDVEQKSTLPYTTAGTMPPYETTDSK